MAKKIILVCTGNTCRSSMAEILLKDLLQKNSDLLSEDFEVVSAGTSAFDGDAASGNAVAAMSAEGLDLSGHQARRLTKKLINDAWLILTMTKRHRDFVCQMVPQAASKTFTLKEYTNDSQTELIKQSNELSQTIMQKQKDYYEQHRQLIDSLRDKYEKLIVEIKNVEQQLKEIESLMNAQIKQEKQEFDEIQVQLTEMDILDPFGQSVDVYKECAREIKENLDKLIKRLASNR